MAKTAAHAPADDPLLTVNDVAAYLKVHRARVYAIMRDEALPYVLVGTRRRVRMSDLQRYLDT